MEHQNITIDELQDNYYNHLTSYLPDFTGYLPQKIKNGISFFNSNLLNEIDKQFHQTILYSSIEKIPLNHPNNNQWLKFLIIGYSDGFQLWDINKVDHLFQIISKRGHAVQLGRIYISKPLDNSQNVELMLAIVPKIESIKSSSSILKFFSLYKQEYVHELNFNEEILNIEVNQEILAIRFHTSIHLYHPTTFDCIQILNNVCSETNGSMALGSCWLAFPGRADVQEISFLKEEDISISLLDNPDITNLFNKTKIESVYSMSDIAQGAASSLYFFKKKGCKSIAPYLSNKEDEKSTISSNNRLISKDRKDLVGYITIYDFQINQYITEFQAHHYHLSIIKFDQSGTLLVTARHNGQNLHVYKIMPNLISCYSYRHQLLYKLNRGITHAFIHHISFTPDNRFIAVFTSRGTCHLFAINSNGGPIKLLNYSKDPPMDFNELFCSKQVYQGSLIDLLDERENNKLLILTASTRLRIPFLVNNPKQNLKENEHLNVNISCSMDNGIMMISCDGYLSQIRFESDVLWKHGEKGIEKIEKELHEGSLKINLLEYRRWNMCRNDSSNEVDNKFCIPFPSIDQTTSTSSDKPEIQTHHAQLVSLWSHPNVTFQNLQEDKKCFQTKEIIFVNDITCCTLSFRKKGPVPIESGSLPPESFYDSMDKKNKRFGKGESPVFDGKNTLQSDPLVPSLQLRESISFALNTPVNFSNENIIPEMEYTHIKKTPDVVKDAYFISSKDANGSNEISSIAMNESINLSHKSSSKKSSNPKKKR